jgi:hypothetical protein
MSWIDVFLYRTVWLLSGEFLLHWPIRRANGGTIIFARATMITIIVYSGAIFVHETLDPSKTWEFSSLALRLAINTTLPWFAAVFAGTYAALYARFASQWSYLAGLYNLIKSTEAQSGISGHDAVISMKAGFIEDAEELHLALKQMYAALIRNWLSDLQVREEFIKYAPGGERRLQLLLTDVNRVIASYEKYYAKK